MNVMMASAMTAIAKINTPATITLMVSVLFFIIIYRSMFLTSPNAGIDNVMHCIIYQGETLTFPFTVQNTDLTGFTFVGQIDFATPYLLASKITINNASTGSCTLSVPSSDTASWYAPQAVRWTLSLISPGGIEQQLWRGNLVVEVMP